jgi:hypothetical protein
MPGSDDKKISESGMHEIQHLADPADQVRYRHLQWVAFGSAVTHVIAVFLAIYAFREGDLQELSLVNLMHFVPGHVGLWQLTCFSIACSSLSFLMLYLALKQILRLRHSLWITAATFVVVIAIAIDLQSYGNLTVVFSDLCVQLTKNSGYKQLLMLEGWRTVNQGLTQSVLIANSLYSLAGLVMAAAIVAGKGLPKWLGWTSVPIWLAGLAASVLTFCGQLSWALVIMFAMTIAFIIWTIALAVAVDPYTHSHRFPIELDPAN